MHAMLTLRGSNKTTVKDIVELRKYIGEEFGGCNWDVGSGCWDFRICVKFKEHTGFHTKSALIVSIIQGKTWIVDDSLPSVRFLLGIVLYIWTQSRLAPKTSQVSKTAPEKKTQ